MKYSPIIVPSLALLLAGAVHADTLASPQAVSTSTTYAGSGSGSITGTDFFTVQVEPFDSSLGTLVSFSFAWDASGTLDGTIQSGVAGYANAFFGGTFYWNGNPFDGAGGSEGDFTGSDGAPFSTPFVLPTHTFNHLVSDAGVNYDPALLAAITGTASYTLEAKNGKSGFASIEYGNVASLVAAVQEKVTVTYNYIPASTAPHSSALKVTRVAHDSAAKTASLDWSSQNGSTYSVDASANLSDWTVISSGISATAPSNSFTESSLPADGAPRFYRVRSH